MAPDQQHTLPAELEHWLVQQRDDSQLLRNSVELLARMVEIDTTPMPEPQRKAAAEREVFELICTTLRQWAPAAEPTLLPIRPEIAADPWFTRPYYAALPVEEPPAEMAARVYRDRNNLLVRWGEQSAGCIGLNAHIDTVAPHIPPRIEGLTVHGRGTADDKGPCLTMMLVLKHLSEIQQRFGIAPACGVKLAFVIDEETGGNGSLSLAAEPVAVCDPLIVLECTDLNIHPGNRGAVWYELELATSISGAAEKGKSPGVSLLEAAAFVVGELEQCGRQLKQESDHPLFPHRPVQTCHGRIGSFGEHPSRVGDYVALELHAPGIDLDQLRPIVDAAVREYCAQYGDKTAPGAANPALQQHLRWSTIATDHHLLEVYGLAGHMGSVDRLDGAITKAATIVRALVQHRQHHAEWSGMRMQLARQPSATALVLEGGQGFVPTHKLEEVCGRMTAAARTGVGRYAELIGIDPGLIACAVRFDKLHNDAFARPADGAAFLALRRSAAAAGLAVQDPPRGWDVSCDARLFARQWPQAEIITFGPGHLAAAHSNTESLDIRDAIQAAETLTRFVLNHR